MQTSKPRAENRVGQPYIREDENFCDTLRTKRALLLLAEAAPCLLPGFLLSLSPVILEAVMHMQASKHAKRAEVGLTRVFL